MGLDADSTTPLETGSEAPNSEALNSEATTSEATTSEALKKARQRRRSLAEWVTLTVSTLVLTVLVGLVLYDWQLSKDLPPAFQIEIVEATRLTEGRYYVPFTLRNTGGRIARTVQVIAELNLPTGDTETGEQQFDFLSGNERKKGGFVFEHNPQTGDLAIRVASFGLP